jgi:hypothetical protein
VALPFTVDDAGESIAGAGEELQSPNAAMRRAEALSRVAGNVGAVAFSRTGDPAVGEFFDAVVLKAFGEVPDDLSEL